MHRTHRCCWVCLAALAFCGGCRSRSDLVEAELRVKDRQLRELHGQLTRAESTNEVLENTLRDQKVPHPGACSTAVPTIKNVELGRGTGGIDEDRAPGDEGILVVLIPRDVDGSTVKTPGSLSVTAMQITPEGLKSPLSTWDVSISQLRGNWREGLLSTGYHVFLPWKCLPSTEKLRVIAQFRTADGILFEAEKDVTVRVALPPGPGRALPPPTITETPGSILPAPTPIPDQSFPPPYGPTSSEKAAPIRGISRRGVELLPPVATPPILLGTPMQPN